MGNSTSKEQTRFREEIAVERLATSCGVDLQEVPGRGEGVLVGDCLFCQSGGSLVVSRGPNTWRCESCGEDGSVMEWVQRAEGVSFSHAVELLREGLPITGDAARAGKTPPKATTRSKLPSPLDVDLSDDALLEQVVCFYQRTLAETTEGIEYLAGRGITNPEIFDRFRIGYANRTLCYRLPQANRNMGAALRGQLRAIGVLRQSGHEHFRGSVVFPISDPTTGRVTQVYGRKLGGALRKGTPLHTWLPGGQRGVFNPEAFGAGDELIVAPSLIDALTFWSAGFGHVTAIAGPEGWGDDHTAALETSDIGRVLLAFRRDDTDQREAARLAGQLMGTGVEVFGLEFPDGMDANDYACASRSAADALGQAIRSAVWMGNGRHAPKPPPTPPEPVDVDEPIPEPEPEPDVDEATREPEPVSAEVVELEPEGDGLVTSPVPKTPGPEPSPELVGDEMRITYGDRRWRVRGLAKNTSFDSLRLNVLVSTPGAERGAGFHVDTLDLYSARARSVFAKEAASEIGAEEATVRRDLGRVLLAAEEFVEKAITEAAEPEDTAVVLAPDERAAAMELLTDPKLVDRIVDDFARAGMVGEATNCLVGYLAATSRMLDQPLAVIVQSTSAAGKSALQDAVLDFVPDEDLIRYSAMTGQSLYYLGENDLAHKVLAIAEEEGAERASYALKLLQSEGELSIASTGKDTASGRLTTHPYRVKGPAAIFLTTTAIDIDEELLNRCVVLTVDEDRAQTRAIHDRQRRAQTLDGLLAGRERDAVLKVHRDAQRLLEPLAVVNPYADRLTFADVATRTRRDHLKYLTLIRAIALVHQHQRARQVAQGSDGSRVVYIEATLADIDLANRLAHEVLGRSLDELPPQTRRLLDALDGIVADIAETQSIDRDRVRFTRRQVREALGWGDTQLKVHLGRLVDLELIWAHRAERWGGFVYELAWNPDHDGDRYVAGLVDIDTLAAHRYDTDQSAPNGQRSGAGRRPVGGKSAGGRAGSNGTKPQASPAEAGSNGSTAAKHASGDDAEDSSYAHEQGDA